MLVPKRLPGATPAHEDGSGDIHITREDQFVLYAALLWSVDDDDSAWETLSEGQRRRSSELLEWFTRMVEPSH